MHKRSIFLFLWLHRSFEPGADPASKVGGGAISEIFGSQVNNYDKMALYRECCFPNWKNHAEWSNIRRF